MQFRRGKEDYTYESTAEHHEEYLDRHNPANSRTVVIPKWPRNVVFLKDTHTVHKSECTEQSTPASKDDKPCLQSSVREICRGHSGWRTCRRLLLFLLI